MFVCECVREIEGEREIEIKTTLSVMSTLPHCQTLLGRIPSEISKPSNRGKTSQTLIPPIFLAESKQELFCYSRARSESGNWFQTLLCLYERTVHLYASLISKSKGKKAHRQLSVSLFIPSSFQQIPCWPLLSFILFFWTQSIRNVFFRKWDLNPRYSVLSVDWRR